MFGQARFGLDSRLHGGLLGIGEGEDLSSVRIPDTHPQWANEIVEREGIPTAIREGLWAGETALLGRDGREIPISQVILAHKDADGRVDYLSTIARDISERKHIEQLRQEYLQAMSHDLRSPLSAISAQAQLLQATLVEGRSEADARRSLAAIRRGVARMAEMIQDLAQSVRMEGGCPQLERRPIPLGPFVADLLAGGLVAHSERVRLEVPPDCLEVHADADSLARILSNLLGNALKFSPPASGVLVTAHPEGDDVVVSVADEGPGVAAVDLPRSFERFYRAGKARGIEGLGLGLYITRKLVEAHAGRIWVDSGTGRGATFRFTLPGCPPDSPAA